MLLYALKRILHVIPVTIGVSIVCFMLIHIAPGDPLAAILPSDASAEMQAQMRSFYGLDQPLPVQYALWAWHALKGDLGTSIASDARFSAKFSMLPSTHHPCSCRCLHWLCQRLAAGLSGRDLSWNMD